MAKFINIFSTNEEFRNLVKTYTKKITNQDNIMDMITDKIFTRQKEAELEEEGLKTVQQNREPQTPIEFDKRLSTNEKILFQFSDINDLWKFLFINKDIVFNITNWNLYTPDEFFVYGYQVGDVSKEFTATPITKFDCNEGDIPSTSHPTEISLFSSGSQVYSKSQEYYQAI